MNEDWVVTRDLHVISKKNTPILFILTCFKTSNSERRVLHRMKSDVGKSHLQLNNGAGACLLSLSHATPFPSLPFPSQRSRFPFPRVRSFRHARCSHGLKSRNNRTGMEWNRDISPSLPYVGCWGCVALLPFLV